LFVSQTRSFAARSTVADIAGFRYLIVFSPDLFSIVAILPVVTRSVSSVGQCIIAIPRISVSLSFLRD